jgi:hypothetical protein
LYRYHVVRWLGSKLAAQALAMPFGPCWNIRTRRGCSISRPFHLSSRNAETDTRSRGIIQRPRIQTTEIRYNEKADRGDKEENEAFPKHIQKKTRVSRPQAHLPPTHFPFYSIHAYRDSLAFPFPPPPASPLPSTSSDGVSYITSPSSYSISASGS